MGKASRRARGERDLNRPKVASAPYVARPFEGLPGETSLVAMREIVPSATGTLTLKHPLHGVTQITVGTVLPVAWPGLRRADGEALIGLQSGNSSGDASRDLAQVITAVCETEPGNPVGALPLATVDTPRLQDLVDVDAGFEPQLHEGFDWWVAEGELDAEGRQSLNEANETVVPTQQLDGLDACYWVLLGDRAYVRWVLPHEEDAATDGFARLKAAGTAGLDEASPLLGAFRSSGLLIPVWEVDPAADPQSFVAGATAVRDRLEAELADERALTDAERRARAELRSRQITIR